MQTRSAPGRCVPISCPAHRSALPAWPAAPPGWPGIGRRSPARSRLRNWPYSQARDGSVTEPDAPRYETVTALSEEATARLALLAEGALEQLARVAHDLPGVGVQVDGGLVDLPHRRADYPATPLPARLPPPAVPRRPPDWRPQ